MSSSKNVLSHIRLGLSLSESPDIERLGFSDVHFRDIVIEFSRYMLSCGATLAYGGDFRQGGFTELLFDLRANYRGSASKIVSYLGWPIHAEMGELSPEEKLKYQNAAEFEKCPIPDGVSESIPRDKFLPPIRTNLDNMLIWARSMSKMRREYLAEKNDAQILLGGRLTDYSSKYPGVVEEAYEIMKAKKPKPLFLIGAFGGATKAIIDAVTGARPESLTEEGQYRLWAEHEATSGKPQNYKGLVEHFNANAPESEERIDYTRLVDFFQEKGIGGLNNHLSIEENQRLFVTPHVAEMIALVLKGLACIKN